MIARFFSFTLVLFTVFLASRALIRSLPGDPLETLVAETGTPLPRELLQKELHLDRPFISALAMDVKNALQGDFGKSIFSRQPVGPMLVQRFLNTLALTLAALAIGMSISMIAGLKACGLPDQRFTVAANRFCNLHGALAAALPTPWIGPVLAYVFCVWIPVFPIGGHIALPAITLSIGFSGFWARLIRQRVREILQPGSAQGARARGVPEWKVLLKYGLAPASGSLVAYLGTQLGGLMAGAFVTEIIFDWPGMGLLFVEAVLRRDYPVVEAAAFVTAAVALTFNALGDWAQSSLVNKRESEAIR